MNQLSSVVEVFKTDINKKKVAQTLVKSLSIKFPGYKINIDFADHDKVLRVESEQLCDVNEIVRFVQQQNVKIELLPDYP